MTTIDQISKSIAKLPGMGPRIAKRIILHLAKNKDQFLIPLINSLNTLNEHFVNCSICGNLDSKEICSICLNKELDDGLICVVEDVSDLWAIERAGIYSGKYHVLGGSLSAFAGRGVGDIRMNSLFDRIKQGDCRELIIATSATIDGQTTANFIIHSLKDEVDKRLLKITRLTYGIPIGGELDYLDEGTISIALKTRREI